MSLISLYSFENDLKQSIRQSVILTVFLKTIDCSVDFHILDFLENKKSITIIDFPIDSNYKISRTDEIISNNRFGNGLIFLCNFSK